MRRLLNNLPPEGSVHVMTVTEKQSASLTQCQHVVPHAPGTIGAVAAQEALMNLAAKQLVFQTALASGPAEPRIEAASQDTG